MQHKAGVRVIANALRIPPCLAHPPTKDDFNFKANTAPG